MWGCKAYPACVQVASGVPRGVDSRRPGAETMYPAIG